MTTTMTKQHWQSNVDNDGDDGNGGDGDGDGNGKGDSNDALAATDSDDVDDNNGSNSRTAIRRWHLDDNNGTMKICVDDDGVDGNGGDSKDDGDGNGNGNGMATPMMPPPLTAKMSMMMTAAIQGRQLDVNDGTTLM
jgi:hypothetical protein